jgi:hypothetical protein
MTVVVRQLTTVAAARHTSPTFRFSGRVDAKWARLIQELCAVAGR